MFPIICGSQKSLQHQESLQRMLSLLLQVLTFAWSFRGFHLCQPTECVQFKPAAPQARDKAMRRKFNIRHHKLKMEFQNSFEKRVSNTTSDSAEPDGNGPNGVLLGSQNFQRGLWTLLQDRAQENHRPEVLEEEAVSRLLGGRVGVYSTGAL